MKRILLVDDHPVMRYGLAQLIQAEDDLEVCGEAGSAAEALTRIEELLPDLAIVDMTLPDRNGLELIKEIVARFEEVATLVVSMHDESLYAERVLRAGGRGYIMKEEAASKLIEAIRRVLSGGVFVSDNMSALIVEMFAKQNRRSESKSPIKSLTDREFEIFQLIGNGKGTRDIANQLKISTGTIDAHRAHIKEKLRLEDGNALVRHAVRWIETEKV